MADSDFLSYSSIYETFSKGPKSIYYGVGDEMLPGAILNVPQTDTDDEWGRTERIAGERTYDFIAKIYKTLFDPYNALSDISLTPGEAGSEINVAKNMVKLVGRSGVDVGIFDLSLPTMAICGVVISGPDNAIYIGSDFEASANNLTLSTNFSLSGTSSTGTIAFKNVYTELYDNSTIYKYTISVNGSQYVFGEVGGVPQLELPTGGKLKLTGDLITNNVYPVSTCGYSIGSSSLIYREIYASDVFATNLNSPNTNTNTILPYLCSSVTIGDLDNSTDINIRSGNFKLYNNSDALSAISLNSNTIFLGTTAYDYDVKVQAGTFSVYSSDPATAVFSSNASNLILNKTVISGLPCGVNLGGPGVGFDGIWVGNINSGTGTFAGTLTTKAIMPDADNSYNVGSSILKYSTIYANRLYTENGLYSSNATNWEICGPNLNIKNSISNMDVLLINSATIEARVCMTSLDILPKTDVSNNIGSASLAYNTIYTSQLNARFGLFNDTSTAWTICGPNLNIKVSGDTKIGICDTFIEMYEPVYSLDIYPSSPTGTYIGSTGSGYEAIYLRDQSTGLPVRVYVCGGILNP
jgi:hypothetical protein